ncbi:hypothetical protein LILAB_25090 [Corallococcus macrosporus]|uniref:Uncharacterized protein n=1 Tax=Myxococcus fulvus (strain ATCC BAA-855 / HW-1) TaxID=483219 RepID=F8C6W9_MYXFH|nr:hypothetical protein LILAB_25090 [Corallococcus macrosporus]
MDAPVWNGLTGGGVGTEPKSGVIGSPAGMGA